MKVIVICLHLTITKYCHLIHCLDAQNICIPQDKTAVQKRSSFLKPTCTCVCLIQKHQMGLVQCNVAYSREWLWWRFFLCVEVLGGSRSSQLQPDTQIVEVLSYCGKLSLWKISNMRNLTTSVHKTFGHEGHFVIGQRHHTVIVYTWVKSPTI